MASQQNFGCKIALVQYKGDAYNHKSTLPFSRSQISKLRQKPTQNLLDPTFLCKIIKAIAHIRRMTNMQASQCLLPSCPHIISSRVLRRPALHHREGRRQILTQATAQGSTFGQLFRVTTYGTSHGLGVGCIIDGCPPRLPITVEEIQHDLDRRRPGQSRITTPRKESDTCQIASGVSSTGWTEGDPIHITVPNATQRSQDYTQMEEAYRPSHADATYDMKYGTRAVAGGGRASARETIGRVAAGAIAKKLLKQVCGTEVLACLLPPLRKVTCKDRPKRL